MVIPFESRAIASQAWIPFPVSTPKSDLHCGYPVGQDSNFSSLGEKVICHPYAQKYSRPTPDNRLPFLAFEVTSEASGSTMWQAENQAAGSGSHIVSAYRWLLQQSSKQDSFAPDKALGFTVCLTARAAILYVHYYNEKDQKYHMSVVNSYWLHVPADIQKCNRDIKNLLDYGLGARREAVNEVLEKLWPIPQAWSDRTSRKRKAEPLYQNTPITSTLTSISTQDSKGF